MRAARPPVSGARLLPVALTGSPGTGKSAAARALGDSWKVREIGELGRALGVAKGRGRAVEVDLPRLARRLTGGAEPVEVDLLVGHLAHLLPCRAAIVLRCHPSTLLARLRKARRGNPSDRAANVVAEATDLVLVEALELGRPVVEIDTTRLSPRAIARRIERILEGRVEPSYGRVRWLEDRKVTDDLLPSLL